MDLSAPRSAVRFFIGTRPNQEWEAEKVVQVDPVETEGWPFPVPGLITDCGALAGRQVPVLFELAARGYSAVRHQRSGKTKTDRSGLAGWRDRTRI